MTLPHFLIIGAMKCGSTTLYRDLLTHPRVFFPIDKEPGNLCDDRVLTDEGLADYEALFKRAGADQLCAEASTDYTKRPDREGVAERAVRVLGPELKLIYLVRDPLKRLISHHHHEYSRGEMPRDIAQAVADYPALVNYSLYAMQLEPWLDAFAPGAIRVVRFEDYVADRRAHAGELQRFLGLDPRPELIQTDRAHNTSADKPVAVGPMGRLIRSGPYRRFVRPLMPMGLKERARRALLPKAPPRPPGPGEALSAQLRERFRDDQRRLDEIITSQNATKTPIPANASGPTA